MALITADEFRERFDIDSVILDARLEPHIGSASRRLRKWVGDTIYDAAAALVATPDEDDDDGNARLADLQSAEAHLAYHFAIFGMNFAVSSKGSVATATSDEGREMRKYLAPKEVSELSTYFLELAREIADLVVEAVHESGTVIVGLDDASCEGATRTSCGTC